VLALQELEKGNLSLQDPISKYLPRLTQSWVDSVKVYHLLNHTSGITALDKPLAFKPGTQFSYSGLLSFQLLGSIIEKTSGKSYAALATDLFRKCNMKYTTIPASYKNGRLVKCYIEQVKGKFGPKPYNLKEIEPFTPAGGIISTAEDLAIWNKCLNGGKLLKKKQLSTHDNRFCH
jgi:CubicO group peptidase (beta-lactamase class C family)